MQKQFLILTGGQIAYHNYPESARLLAEILQSANIATTVSHDPQSVEDLSPYAAAVVFTDGDFFTDSQLDSIVRFVQGGGGFISIHTTAGTNKSHVAFSQLIGSQIRGGIITSHRVKIVSPSHPFLHGISEFELDDEIHDLEPLAPFTTLLSADMHGKPQPLMYVRKEGSGDVIHFATGHSLAGIGNPTWQQIFTTTAKSLVR